MGSESEARPGAARRGGAADPFSSRVLMVVRRIPPGRVATYGEVAALAGRPRAARAVGNIMKGCRRPDVPCHRVIAAGGRLGGYGGSEGLKRALLAAEGVVVAGTRIRELERVHWNLPKAYRPAASLKAAGAPPPAAGLKAASRAESAAKQRGRR